MMADYVENLHAEIDRLRADQERMREALHDVLTGDGAQLENLDAEFLAQSMDEIWPNCEDAQLTVTKATVLKAVAALSTPRQPEPEELHADADVEVCDECGKHWVSDEEHFACPLCGTEPRPETTP